MEFAVSVSANGFEVILERAKKRLVSLCANPCIHYDYLPPSRTLRRNRSSLSSLRTDPKGSIRTFRMGSFFNVGIPQESPTVLRMSPRQMRDLKDKPTFSDLKANLRHI